MRTKIIIGLILFMGVVPRSFSQVDEMEPPILTYLSVNPYTGEVFLQWEPSLSPDVEYYEIRFRESSETGFFVIATVNENIREYSYFESLVSTKPLEYAIDAMDTTGYTGPLSNSLSTLYLSLTLDTCTAQIILQWKNNNDPEETFNYQIYNMNDTSMVGSTSDSTWVVADFNENEELCFYLEAIKPNHPSSFSPKACIYTKMAKIPDYINTDYVTIENQVISLSFTIDPSSQLTTFYIIRADMDTTRFDTIARITEPHDQRIRYTDPDAPITSIHYYKLLAVNSCNNIVQTSNTGNNMVLNAHRKGNEISFEWNPYLQWFGGVDNYVLYRYARNNTRMDTFVLPNDRVNYIDNLEELINTGYYDQVCYVLEARETYDNDYGIKGISRSNKQCFILSPEIPNAFTPNGDMMNDKYRPIITCIAENYHLIIKDRWGTVVFESSEPSEEWDGSHPEKGKVEAGVYIYYLKFTTFEGHEVVRNGYVSVLLPP